MRERISRCIWVGFKIGPKPSFLYLFVGGWAKGGEGKGWYGRYWRSEGTGGAVDTDRPKSTWFDANRLCSLSLDSGCGHKIY